MIKGVKIPFVWYYRILFGHSKFFHNSFITNNLILYIHLGDNYMAYPIKKSTILIKKTMQISRKIVYCLGYNYYGNSTSTLARISFSNYVMQKFLLGVGMW